MNYGNGGIINMGEMVTSNCKYMSVDSNNRKHINMDKIFNDIDYMASILDTLYKYAHYESTKKDIVIRIPQENKNDYNLIMEWVEDLLNK